MGPRARARGNTPNNYGDQFHAFASMGPRARARGNTDATTGALRAELLQWGHERALVEMSAIFWKLHTFTCFNGATSARSWKWSVGRKPRGSCFGFNGATSARSWKLSAFASSTVNCLASLGPRARARGNTAPRVSRIGARTLQWGHERALVEIGIRALHRGPAQASMGPRARARGNVSFSSKFEQKKEASMGPRARARGNKTK